MIRYGENGYTLDGASVAKLTQLMATLCHSPQQRITIGEAARKTAEQYTCEAMTEQVTRQYETILKQSKNHNMNTATVQKKERLLVVSHACVTPVNQLLFVALEEEYPQLEITVLVPGNWKNEYTGKNWDIQLHPRFKGRLVKLPVWISGHISLHFYRRDLEDLLDQFRPNWIYLDEEPWAVVTQQVARINMSRYKAPFLFHTNQNINKKYPWPFSTFEQWVYRHASHALPVGEEAAQVLRDKGYENPSTVFPYGIDETVYKPLDAEAQSLRQQYHCTERFIFGFLGRLAEEKGVNHLIDAFYQLRNKNSVLSSLWIIGSGPESERLKQQAHSLGLAAPDIQFIDNVRHEEAPRYLSAFDVCVMPSLTRPFWKEQFGRVIIEALACKTAIIGSDSGEIPHLIGKLHGGLVFPEGDTPALAEKMAQFLMNPQQLKQCIETSYAQVHRHYTNSQLARGFYEILNRIQSD